MSNKLLNASLSAATRSSYDRMVKTYVSFCKEHFPSVSGFPSTQIMISRFISYLFVQNYQPSTIASYVSAISFVHKINDWSDPTDSFLVKKILKGSENLRQSSDVRLPITKDILSKLAAAVPAIIRSPYNASLLKAMMSLAYYCFLRIGEIAVKNRHDTQKVIQINDVHFEEGTDKQQNLRVNLRNFKHCNGQSKTILLTMDKSNVMCPVSALLNYLKLAGHNSGPLFQFQEGIPITAYYFNQHLKLLLQAVGLSSDYYKGHSFRIGAATSAATRGVPLSVIQHMGRWKSNAFQHYIRLYNF